MSSVLCPPTGWLAHRAIRLRPAGAWHYTGGKRDLRLDLLRGFAVLAMVADHIGGERSWLYALTGGDRFFVSVAEGFVFISGLLMGIIYAQVVARHGLGAALLKCLQRAWTLYLLTITLTLTSAALSLQMGLAWAPRVTSATWLDFVLSVLTLHRTLYLTDIPLLYTLLVLAAVPVLVLLASGYTKVVLAGAWGLWALWQLAPQHAQFPWPIADNQIFNFSAWQVLFVTAMVIGYHRRDLARRLAPLPPHVVLGFSGALVAGTIALYALNLYPLWTEYAMLVDPLFGKIDLRFGRLLVFASFFSFALALLTVVWGPISRALGWLLLPLGQNALTAYTLHLFVVALLPQVSPWIAGTIPTTTVQNTLLQTVGIMGIWAAIKLQPTVMTQYHRWLARMTGLLASRRRDLYIPGYSRELGA